MKIFCIIPAYNEEKNISKVLQEVRLFVDEVVVVDDCSSDKTADIARKNKVTLLRHVINRGQGAALETGNQYALKQGADIIVHFDADGQFLAREIKDIVRPIIKDQADVVFGSRFLEKKSRIPWLKKILIFPLAKLVNSFIFNINLKDPQSGFRAMNKKAVKTIPIENDGSAHCSEIIYKVFQNKLRVKEVPMTVIYNDFGQNIIGGRGRRQGGLNIIKDLLLGKFIN